MSSPPSADGGSRPRRSWRRFLVTLLFFGLLNGLGLWWIWRGLHPEAPAVRVAVFAPRGEAEPGATLRFVFDRDVIASGVEILPPAEGLVEIEPPLEGKARWKGRRELRFEPAEPLPLATPFRVRLRERLDEVLGARLDGSREFSFQTPPLRLEGVRQVGFTRDLTATLELEFNDRVAPGDLAAKLHLLDGEGRAVEYQLSRRVPVAKALVRTRRGASRLVLRLDAGLRGQQGPLGLARAHEVPVALTYRLRLEGASATAVFTGQPVVTLRFNNPVDADKAGDLASWFSLEPPLEFTASAQAWNSRVVLRGPFRPGERYAVSAKQGLPGAGDCVLVEDTTVEVDVPDRSENIAFVESSGLITPEGSQLVALRSANVERAVVTAHRVLPENLIHYLHSSRSWASRGLVAAGAVRREIELDAPRNEVVESTLDLREIAGASRGSWILDVRKEEDDVSSDTLAVTVSDLALSTRFWHDGAVVWVTSISSGRPVAGAEVTLWSYNNRRLASRTTDERGLVTFDGPFDGPLDGSCQPGDEPADSVVDVVTARREGDLSWLQPSDSLLSMGGLDVGGRKPLGRGYEAFLFTERGVYRPGESAHLQAIARTAAHGVPEGFPVVLEVRRPDGRLLRRLRGETDAGGAVGWDLELPETVPTGAYRARLRLPGEGGDELGSTRFHVEEFLPERMRAKLGLAPAGELDPAGGPAPARRFALGDEVSLALEAEYLAGLAAARAKGTVAWRLSRTAFRPEGWKGYSFGDPEEDALDAEGTPEEATLDESGKATIAIRLPEITSSRPLRLLARAEVEGASGRPAVATCSLDVDALPFYLGVRAEAGTRLEVGEPARFEVAAVRPGGALSPLEGVDLELFRVEWTTAVERGSSGRYRYRSRREEKSIEKRHVAMSEGRGKVELRFPSAGAYRLALVEPDSGARASRRLRVTGPGWYSGRRQEQLDRLDLTISPTRLRPGDTARVGLSAPFAGTLLLTVESDRVLSTRVAEIAAEPAAFDVEVPRDATSDLYVGATLVRALPSAAERQDSPAPTRAWGVEPFPLDFSPEQLVVSLEGPDLVTPRSRVPIRVRVTGADGTPRPAEVFLAVVDEGILRRTGYATPDPWGFFYAKRALGVRYADRFGEILPELSVDERRALPGGDEAVDVLDGGARLLNPIRARRVRPLALWLGARRLREAGEWVETVTLPAFSGEARVMAIAHQAHRFGAGELPITVRSPVHVEIAMPRFLAPGDRFISTLEVFNTTAAPGSAELTWEFDGPLGPPVPPGATDLAFAGFRSGLVNLGAGESRRLKVPLRAGELAGVGRARLEAVLGEARFADEVELAVRPPAAPQRSVRSGRITAEDPLRLELAARFLQGTARHRLVFSPSPEVDLLGSLSWLIEYPWGCLEQTTSRCFPLLYLRDLSKLLRSSYRSRPGADLGRAEESIDEFVQAGIDRILSMQGRRGWLGMWPGARTAWEWGSLYGAHFLVEAKAAGYEVPEESLDALLGYVEESLLEGRTEEPGTWRDAAYAAWILALAGREGIESRLESLEPLLRGELEGSPDGAGASGTLAALSRGATGASGPGRHRARSTFAGDPALASSLAEGRCFLAAAWLRCGRPERARSLLGEEFPEAPSHRGGGSALESPARQTALLLATLVDIDPQDPAVAVLVGRLNGYRVGGRWGTTQENAFALLALGKYARRQRELGASYTARVAVGEEVVQLGVGDSRVFEGDLSGKSVNVELEGDGALWWYLEEDGVPADGRVEEVDSGLVVRRRYLDARGEALDGGPIPKGEVVQVEITLDSARALENVVVIDPLPAGLEVENPRLAGAAGAAAPLGQISPSHWELRDDRAIFWLDLPRGEVASFRYAARAVTAGDFALPAVSAECMYRPGIYSRHGAGRLVVEEKE